MRLFCCRKIICIVWDNFIQFIFFALSRTNSCIWYIQQLFESIMQNPLFIQQTSHTNGIKMKCILFREKKKLIKKRILYNTLSKTEYKDSKWHNREESLLINLCNTPYHCLERNIVRHSLRTLNIINFGLFSTKSTWKYKTLLLSCFVITSYCHALEYGSSNCDIQTCVYSCSFGAWAFET